MRHFNFLFFIIIVFALAFCILCFSKTVQGDSWDIEVKVDTAYSENRVFPEIYGAVGDGKADDTDAIQKAMDSGKNVMFYPKTYRIEGTVSVKYPIDINGNGCLIVGTGSAERRAVFEIRSDSVNIRNFRGRFYNDAVYSGDHSVKGNNIKLISVSSNHVNIENIETKGAFSTVFLTDRNHAIKHDIRINNIIAEDGDMNIFMRYADGVIASNLKLSIRKRCSELHPIYICSDVSDVSINDVIITGYKARDLISIHPSSQTPKEYNISNIQFARVKLQGDYQYGLVFRYCKDITIDSMTMDFDKRLSRWTDFCSVFEAEHSEGITLMRSNCKFLGNLCRMSAMGKTDIGGVLVKDSHFEFTFTHRASHAIIRYAENLHIDHCEFTTDEDAPVALVNGNENVRNLLISNSVFRPQKGLLAKMEGGSLNLKACSLYNKKQGVDYAVVHESGECHVVGCSAYGVSKGISNKKLKGMYSNKAYSKQIQ